MLDETLNKPTPISKKMWALFVVFGLFGQIAWAVENMYFNLFVYNTIVPNTRAVTVMVQASGIMATVATLVIGALSDRIGRRKVFISWGYIIWGIVTLSFAFITPDNVQKMFSIDPARTSTMFGLEGISATHVIAMTLMVVIIMDCVMTFFGSGANDAAFNAWVTDNTDKTNRGMAEGILSTMPLIALLVVAGGFGMIVEAIDYSGMFIILGSAVSVCGVVGLFVIKDNPKIRADRSGNYFKNIFYGFQPKVIKKNWKLYIIFIAIGIYGIATQVFMPYLIIYLEHYIGFTVMQYSMVLGGVIILTAICVALLGKMSDKYGKEKFLVAAAVLFCIGLFCLYFVKGMDIGVLMALVAVVGFIMLIGYLMLMVLLNALVRDYTPEGDAGKMQGIRMFFYVLLPMFIGPAIGDAINQSREITYVDQATGIVGNVPVPELFLVSALVGIFVFIPIIFIVKFRKEEKSKVINILTRFGEETLNEKIPLSEYPRPQMVRESYINLNGEWEYKILKKEDLELKSTAFSQDILDAGGLGIADGTWSADGKILVPFSPETLLSGVNRTVMPDDFLLYRRTLEIDSAFLKAKTLLNFGAVDYECIVKLNGAVAGTHRGGFTAFSLDVTDLIKAGENTLELIVTDPTDTAHGSRGKQRVDGHGIWYTPQSGIWQTVWLESVSEGYIKDITIVSDIDEDTLYVSAETDSESFTVTAYDNGQEICTAVSKDGKAALKLENYELWSPENPKLYDLKITAGDDEVKSYFGMRKFSLGTDEKGKPRMLLNNKPYFHKGLLDQGYWSDGMLTPPSDEAMIYDIETMKDMGFNMLRKHIKIEPLRWYYHCDRLGVLVWQDMLNGGDAYSFWTIGILPFLGVKMDDTKYWKFGRKDDGGRNEYIQDMIDTVGLLKNSVALSVWVPFNEAWGQFDSVKITEQLRAIDNTRPIDSVSGWHDQGEGTSEFKSLHIYFKPVTIPENEKRVVLLSEFGGYSMRENGHLYNPDRSFGYRMFKTKEELQAAYRKLIETEVVPQIEKGLAATVYTQVSDVQEEVNGILTYDRAVEKFDREFMREMNEKLNF